MKDFNDIKTFFFWIFLAATIGFIFLKCDSSSKQKIIEKNIKNSKKGFLRFEFNLGSTAKSPTIYGKGIIVGSKDTSKTYKITLGENHEFYKEFKNLKEGDFIPIWQTKDNRFVMERRFETQNETIEWLNIRESQETYFFSKLVVLIWGIYIFIFVIIKWIIGKIIKKNR